MSKAAEIMERNEVIEELETVIRSCKDKNPAISGILLILKGSILLKSEDYLLEHIITFAKSEIGKIKEFEARKN